MLPNNFCYRTTFATEQLLLPNRMLIGSRTCSRTGTPKYVRKMNPARSTNGAGRARRTLRKRVRLHSFILICILSTITAPSAHPALALLPQLAHEHTRIHLRPHHSQAPHPRAYAAPRPVPACASIAACREGLALEPTPTPSPRNFALHPARQAHATQAPRSHTATGYAAFPLNEQHGRQVIVYRTEATSGPAVN